jgi:hypothetical protein
MLHPDPVEINVDPQPCRQPYYFSTHNAGLTQVLQPVVFPVGVEEERRECPRLLAKVYLTARHIHSSFLLSIAPEQKRSRLLKCIKIPVPTFAPFTKKGGKNFLAQNKETRTKRDRKYDFTMKVVKSR